MKTLLTALACLFSCLSTFGQATIYTPNTNGTPGYSAVGVSGNPVPSANIATLNAGVATITNTLTVSNVAAQVETVGTLTVSNSFTGPVITNGAVIPSNGDYDLQNVSATVLTGFSANTVYVRKIYVPANLYTSNVVFRVGTGFASDSIAFSLYSYAGNKILDATNVINGGPDIIVPQLTKTNVPAGFYWQAFSVNATTTATMRMVALPNLSTLGTGDPIFGTAANAANNGTNPATLGTITGATLANWPLFIFKN